jgi:hypothetical protein
MREKFSTLTHHKYPTILHKTSLRAENYMHDDSADLPGYIQSCSTTENICWYKLLLILLLYNTTMWYTAVNNRQYDTTPPTNDFFTEFKCLPLLNCTLLLMLIWHKITLREYRNLITNSFLS